VQPSHALRMGPSTSHLASAPNIGTRVLLSPGPAPGPDRLDPPARQHRPSNANPQRWGRHPLGTRSTTGSANPSISEPVNGREPTFRDRRPAQAASRRPDILSDDSGGKTRLIAVTLAADRQTRVGALQPPNAPFSLADAACSRRSRLPPQARLSLSMKSEMIHIRTKRLLPWVQESVATESPQFTSRLRALTAAAPVRVSSAPNASSREGNPGLQMGGAEW
jgi:hypothetical protein